MRWIRCLAPPFLEIKTQQKRCALIVNIEWKNMTRWKRSRNMTESQRVGYNEASITLSSSFCINVVVHRACKWNRMLIL